MHIDEDDFLLKKISSLDIHINEHVFEEIKFNAYAKIDAEARNKYSDKRNLKLKRKSIDQQLSFYRGKKNDNQMLFKDVGEDYFENFKILTNHNKKINGELCSTAYALYLSRINHRRIYFYTDDYPAHEQFSAFFDYQQVGQIKDTADFLILLFWLDESFSEKKLDDMLSNLFSQYAQEVVVLKKRLLDFCNSKIDGQWIKSNKEIHSNLLLLIEKLDRHHFTDLIEFREFFANKKARCSEINTLLNHHPLVFELNQLANSDNLLSKITKARKDIGKNKIHKWDDLCRGILT